MRYGAVCSIGRELMFGDSAARGAGWGWCVETHPTGLSTFGNRSHYYMSGFVREVARKRR
jgi:hypothetical protein